MDIPGRGRPKQKASLKVPITGEQVYLCKKYAHQSHQTKGSS